MITISILGLDQYAIAYYAKNHTTKIANIYETHDDNISFYAPNSFVYHFGVEQNSWNALVRIHAPEKYKVFQEKIAKYIISTLIDVTINVAIEFYYYDSKNRYEKINSEYPRFITDANVVREASNFQDDEDDEDGACSDDDYEEKVFGENIFKEVLPKDDDK
ncbi:MAG: hypothetical protein WC366_00940 [Bacilli bacterium]|jgi:hypothetical protein